MCVFKLDSPKILDGFYYLSELWSSLILLKNAWYIQEHRKLTSLKWDISLPRNCHYILVCTVYYFSFTCNFLSSCSFSAFISRVLFFSEDIYNDCYSLLMANLQLTVFNAARMIIALSSHTFLHWLFKILISCWEEFPSQLLFLRRLFSVYTYTITSCTVTVIFQRYTWFC